MTTTSNITTQGIRHSFSTTGESLHVLDDIHMDIGQGEFVSLIGPSGSGKTTLLRIIGGLLSQTEGRVSIAGVEPVEAQRRKDIGFVFQDAALLPWRTVEQNVRLPLELNTSSNGRGDAELGRLLAAVGLADFGNYYPHQLSGGMKQRVALARALVFDPSVLLMDEPLGALDELTRSAMRYELLQIWEQSRKTVLFVTHSISEAVLLSDRVIVISPRPGRIVDDVRIELSRPRTKEVERTTKFLDYADRILESLSRETAFVSAATPTGEGD
ncbi:MAG: ABC transporter ATP-binding protein [Chloroflexi bacterium]|nr:ABC transporter ATP-binding protein [Chloroflexota bacterium]